MDTVNLRIHWRVEREEDSDRISWPSDANRRVDAFTKQVSTNTNAWG